MKLSALLKLKPGSQARGPHISPCRQTKSASIQQRLCPALLIFMVHPAFAKGNNVQNQPLNLSILCQRIFLLFEHKYSRAWVRLSLADVQPMLHI